MAVHILYEPSMDLKVAGFEWDTGNRDKCRKHGVSLAAVESLFHQQFSFWPIWLPHRHGRTCSGHPSRHRAAGMAGTSPAMTFTGPTARPQRELLQGNYPGEPPKGPPSGTTQRQDQGN